MSTMIRRISDPRVHWGAPTFKYTCNMFREVSWLARVTHDFVTNAVGEKNLLMWSRWILK